MKQGEIDGFRRGSTDSSGFSPSHWFSVSLVVPLFVCDQLKVALDPFDWIRGCIDTEQHPHNNPLPNTADRPSFRGV